ncbi:RHS domain-containing protein, partial [Escherichia coli]|uniref:RHS domain-containing protein n=1 Tax=Escherichia coli TaxID=562 RepID=UPI0039647777
NRLPDPELHPDSTLSMWPDNRIARDAHYLYRYDRYGRLTEKTDLIPEGGIRTDDERTHRYHYDSQHRLVHYTRTQYAEPLVESRYLYDPLGRRVAKRVWRRERDLTGWMSLSRKPQVTWYGWDGDRLTTIQNDRSRIQTIYQPGSFTPLIRVETATGEQAKTQRRSLADTLQQSGGEDGGSVVFPPVLVQMLDRLESEILADRVSEESRRWLASCGLTVEQMQNQMDPVYTPARKIHLYHCDHRGLPLALISTEGATAWCAEYDEWGNLLNEENPHQLQQLIRLPGQQYDEESGLYYNRHRYYDPLQGRYITQDPIGIPYATDPAGNRLPDPELHPDSTLSMWPDNRIARDAHYLYRYDRYGRLTEKTDLIPEGGIRTDDERTHRYHYDSQHRLVHYTRTQYAEPLVESRYLYDPLGRRVAKRVWRRERDLTGWMSLSRKPQVTWYGWDGDRLTTIQNDRSRIQTIYQPGSFTPLIRVETATGELARTQRRSLADALQQSGGEDGGSVVFPPVLVQMLDRLESEILADR